MAMKSAIDRLAYVLFWVSAALLVFSFGMLACKYRLFPYSILGHAGRGLKELKINIGIEHPMLYYRRAKAPHAPALRNTGQSCEGLNLVVRVAAERVLSAKVMDRDGKTLHEWSPRFRPP